MSWLLPSHGQILMQEARFWPEHSLLPTNASVTDRACPVPQRAGLCWFLEQVLLPLPGAGHDPVPTHNSLSLEPISAFHLAGKIAVPARDEPRMAVPLINSGYNDGLVKLTPGC